MITNSEEYKTKIVGVTFKNEDGTSRQEVIESCSEGDSLSLEHYYYKGENAFKVTNVYGETLGNLKKELTEKLVELYDIGVIEAADVEILNITGENKGTLGVNIKITIEEFITDSSDNISVLPKYDVDSSKDTVVTPPKAEEKATSPSKNEATLKMLHDKYGAHNLKMYATVLKILFVFSLLLALFTLIFSFPFAIIFGVIAFICFKYSKLYKKASTYSE